MILLGITKIKLQVVSGYVVSPSMGAGLYSVAINTITKMLLFIYYNLLFYEFTNIYSYLLVQSILTFLHHIRNLYLNLRINEFNSIVNFAFTR